MVQVDTPFSYHEGMNENEEAGKAWTGLVRDAVKEFVGNIGESSKQLSESADKFAAESMSLLNSARESAQRSASESSDMASAAKQAADEARNAVEAIRKIIDEAGPRLREEARAAVEEATSKLSASVQDSQQLKSDLEAQVQTAIARMDTSASQANEAVATAQRAAAEARQAAVESSQNAARAEQTAKEPTVGDAAQAVLERLEVDYQLLTRLVQELHTRITGFVGQPAQAPPSYPTETVTPAMPVAQAVYAEPDRAVVDAPAPVAHNEPEASDTVYTEAEVAEPEHENEPVRAYNPWSPQVTASSSTVEADELVDETPVEEVGVTDMIEEAPVAEAAPLGGMLSGKVMISIAPVPDFDRLLNLDGALGRMANVGNVSLADYAREEVTFRLEIDQPVSSDEFSRHLSEATGTTVEVRSVSDDNLVLRLVS